MIGMSDEIALTAGVLLIILSERAFRRTRVFVARCLSTEGAVVDHTVEENDSGVHYYAVIRFVDSSGSSHQLIRGPAVRQPPKHGSTVPITYDPSYPANAWITGTAAPWVIPWVIRIAGVAAVAGGVLLRWA